MNQHDKYTFVIEKESQSTRIDLVLSLLLAETSRSFIQKLIEGGSMTMPIAIKVLDTTRSMIKNGRYK